MLHSDLQRRSEALRVSSAGRNLRALKLKRNGATLRYRIGDAGGEDCVPVDVIIISALGLSAVLTRYRHASS